MTKNILIAALAIAVVALLIYRRKQVEAKTGNVCFDLTSDPSPKSFGPKYWGAFHSLANKIPCSSCRGFAEKFMVYFHDLVNLKTNSPIYDNQNFVDMTNMICSIKDNGYKFPNA